MVGIIFLAIVLAIAVLVTFTLGIWSIGVGVIAGIGEEDWTLVGLGLLGLIIFWGLSAWALYGVITQVVNFIGLFS